MNIILMGFSTTGKSTILKQIKEKISSKINLLDSDYEISKEYENHIYKLYLKKFDPSDPIKREEIINEISTKESQFLEFLLELNQPYIAALGPNIHIRDNWRNFYEKHTPLTIFLKADTETVFDGLIRREDCLNEIQTQKGFGCWNQGVIRAYNTRSQTYERIPKYLAISNIENLIMVNEKVYSDVANFTFESTQLFDWHKNYNESIKTQLIDLIVNNAG